MIPLLLMLQDLPRAAPVRLDLRNWHSAEVMESGNPGCTFSLSPNFYGIVVRFTGAQDDFEISFDSPGVHVLPTDIPIPLKVVLNGEERKLSGSRVDRRLFFRLDRATVDKGMAKRGMIRVILSDPSIPDTLIARYRLQGKHYEREASTFRTCSTTLRDRSRMVLASGR